MKGHSVLLFVKDLHRERSIQHTSSIKELPKRCISKRTGFKRKRDGKATTRGFKRKNTTRAYLCVNSLNTQDLPRGHDRISTRERQRVQNTIFGRRLSGFWVVFRGGSFPFCSPACHESECRCGRVTTRVGHFVPVFERRLHSPKAAIVEPPIHWNGKGFSEYRRVSSPIYRFFPHQSFPTTPIRSG